MKSGSCPLKAERVFSEESRRKQFDFSRRGDLGHAPGDFPDITHAFKRRSSRSMPSGQDLPSSRTLAEPC